MIDYEESPFNNGDVIDVDAIDRMRPATKTIEVHIVYRWGYDQTVWGTFTFDDMDDLARHVTAFIGAENVVSIVFRN